jgi:hypothetical protein
MFKLRLINLALLIFVAVPAAAATIDFEEAFPDYGMPENYGYGVVESKGFTIRNFDGVYFTPLNSTEGFFIESGFGENGSRGLAYCPWCTLVVEESGGELFSLTSAYLRDQGGLSVTVTGFLSGGGQVQLVASGLGETLVFGEQWSGLTRVEFGSAGSNGGQEIDNIVVNAVPIPAAVWLFGSALAGLGWMRRKQSV